VTREHVFRMKIVVFCPNLIGDTVMATPAFRALRRQFPDARLTGVVRPSVAPTLDGTAWFDELILFHHRSARRGQRTTAIVNQLRHGRHDVAILLPNSFRAAWLAWLAGIPRRIGYSRYGRGLLLTDALQPPRDPAGILRPVPIVEYYLALTRVLGCRHDSLQLELATTPDDEQAADRAWTKLGLPSSKPVVCLNTGGAFGPAKSWPTTSFAALARRLADELGVSVLVLCGPAEREAAREITSLSNHPLVVSLADEELSLGLSKACVRRSALLVSTDSGPRHFAAAFRVPVITLFGPTHIAWTRTYHPRALHLFQPVPCGPCQKSICPEGHHRCMRELDPEKVYVAATRLLCVDYPSKERQPAEKQPAAVLETEFPPLGLQGPALGGGSSVVRRRIAESESWQRG
jgi:heptosyltransferase II